MRNFKVCVSLKIFFCSKNIGRHASLHSVLVEYMMDVFMFGVFEISVFVRGHVFVDLK